MNEQIARLKAETEPLRQQVVRHRLYNQIITFPALQVFMEHQVFAIWDFMSLLKSLQKNITCVSVPWLPAGNAQTRYLINEIVLGVESDADEKGARTSHFELYLRAMRQAGCKTEPITQLLEDVKGGMPVNQVLHQHGVPHASGAFVNHTFSLIHSGKIHIQAVVFIFGRESLIPRVFIDNVNELSKKESGRADIYKYFLERNIEADWAHKSYLGYDLVAELCGDNLHKWEEATLAVKETLTHRLQLWDAVTQLLADMDAVK